MVNKSEKPSNSQKKNFISVNEGFVCEKCGFKNEKSAGSCRNHCTKCLYSLHVDKEVPGDRKSNCKGLMAPIEVDYKGDKGYVIIHKCVKCKKEMNNKAAQDDDFDAIIKLSKHKMT